MTIEVPYQPLPVDQSDVRYLHGPDSDPRPGVPAGETLEFEWAQSKVYPGTTRRFWIHVPAQYSAAEPASVMVFQDGWWYLDPEGEVRAGIVLDNLVHSGAIPTTIGVFVDPGVIVGAAEPKNRNIEYDAFDDRYVTFLLTEILPQVTDRYTISDDADAWGICGGSSGGNCAFTAAWLRPDRFRRVIGFLSSFAQMPGGNPTLSSSPLRRRSLCAFSCRPVTAIFAGTNPRGTGSPTTSASPRSLPRLATNSDSSLATAATAQTMPAHCSLTRSDGFGGNSPASGTGIC